MVRFTKGRFFQLDQPKKNKYRNKKTTVDNITFDSKKEAERYLTLKVLLKAGEIAGLGLQPEYEFIYQGVKICKYRADFRYTENGKIVVEDVKGVQTRDFRIKKKLMRAFFNIEVRII